MSCSVLQCVAMCCAVSCIMLQCVTVCCSGWVSNPLFTFERKVCPQALDVAIEDFVTSARPQQQKS